MRTAAFLAAVLALAAAGFHAQNHPEIDLGWRKQVFVDHKFIESLEGVSLVMNPPVRTAEVLLKPDAPWEKTLEIGGYSTIAVENRRVRLWYRLRGRDDLPGKNRDFMGVAYAESIDGIHFRKPILGLVEFGGSRQNNIVLPVDPTLMSIGGGSVMLDQNPNCPPEERYKS